MALPNTQRLKDFDIYDTQLAGGKPYILYDDKAISNMLIFWITSSQGDYIRNPTLGGIFQELLYKQLLPISSSTISRYRKLIEANFGALITVQNFTIEPDVETRSWVIKLEWISKLTKQPNSTELAIDNKVTPASQSVNYREVNLDGENLYNFVLLKLPDLQRYTIAYSDAEESYIWGNLKLVDLTSSDPYYNSIVLAINGSV